MQTNIDVNRKMFTVTDSCSSFHERSNQAKQPKLYTCRTLEGFGYLKLIDHQKHSVQIDFVLTQILTCKKAVWGQRAWGNEG